MAASEATLEDLIAQGRCEHCGTLGGIWHKLGCPNDVPPPEPVDGAVLDAEREAILDERPETD